MRVDIPEPHILNFETDHTVGSLQVGDLLFVRRVASVLDHRRLEESVAVVRAYFPDFELQSAKKLHVDLCVSGIRKSALIPHWCDHDNILAWGHNPARLGQRIRELVIALAAKELARRCHQRYAKASRLKLVVNKAVLAEFVSLLSALHRKSNVFTVVLLLEFEHKIGCRVT